MNTRKILALILLGGVFVMEGFDIAAMGIAVPRLEGALGMAPASFGWVLTGILVGLGVGGATLAPLGDRFGRRALIVAGCLATGLFTLATSTAATPTTFLIWRFLTGFALGACLPNVSALSQRDRPAAAARDGDGAGFGGNSDRPVSGGRTRPANHCRVGLAGPVLRARRACRAAGRGAVAGARQAAFLPAPPIRASAKRGPSCRNSCCFPRRGRSPSRCSPECWG